MSVQKVELPFDVALLPVRELRAGDLTCLYEHGNLRYIKHGDEEVVRMIYTAVRDENWGTAPYTIQDEVIEAGVDSFTIRYTAIYRLADIHYKSSVQIQGKENVVFFAMQGEALSDFLRNRIGICVLHPVRECAGRTVEIKHRDGTSDGAVFPTLISPHQPFQQVQQMQWKTGAAATAILSFGGEVFETEDQRNWTDFSYKTYSTPLEIPFPVQVRKGDTISQEVTLRLAADDEGAATLKKQEQQVKEAHFPFPKIGYERAPKSPQLTADDVLQLKEIIFDHYRVVLHLSDSSWKDELEMAASEARVLNVPMEIVAVFPTSEVDELDSLATALEGFPEQLASVLVLQEGQPVTPPALLQAMNTIIKRHMPHVKVGYGTDHFFAELNRNRPSPDLPFDFVSCSLNPQVHATDTRTLMENLGAQADVIKTIQSFAAGKEIFISPVTLKVRDGRQQEGGVFADEDSRMHTSFGAVWTMLSIKHLAGAEQISFYQVKGYRGLIGTPAEGGGAPLLAVLRQLKTFQPVRIIVDDTQSLLVENANGDRMAFGFAHQDGLFIDC